MNKKFCECRKLPIIVSVMKIPLMLTMCCHVWHKECKDVTAKGVVLLILVIVALIVHRVVLVAIGVTRKVTTLSLLCI